MKSQIDSFLKNLQTNNYSPQTIIDYRYNLRYFTDWLKTQAISNFSEITPTHIQTYQNYLYHEYTPIRKKSLSLGYQINLLKILKPLFRYLTKTGCILQDPTTDIILPKLPKRLPANIMTKREIKKLLNAPDTSTPRGYRDRLVLELLYATGIRRSELIRLNTDDVNISDRELFIRNGKGGKDRIVPLARKTTAYLETWLTDTRNKMIGDHQTNALLITQQKGRPGKNFIGEIIRKYRKIVKIKKTVTAHSFRHTCATHLLKNNASVRVIQDLLGHQSLSSTQRYTQVEISDLKHAIDKKHPREDMQI